MHWRKKAGRSLRRMGAALRGMHAGAALTLAALGMLCSSAAADLLPQEVVLLYNSRDATSLAIRDAYVATRPGVRQYDLDLVYAQPADAQSPGEYAVTDKFITPASFERDVRRPLIEYVHAEAPNALCFVTTRGLPVLITENFAPGVGHIGENGVYAGFEGALAKLGLEPADKGRRLNPYRGVLNTTFRAFVAQNCLQRQMFLVSRLDAAAGAGTTALQEVLALIARSVTPEVNMFTSTIVIDDTTGGCGSMANGRGGAGTMRRNGWCSYVDTSAAFLHGVMLDPHDTAQCGCPADCEVLTVEYTYTPWKELVHSTLGRNHLVLCDADLEDRECVAPDYVSEYLAHPAGLFLSFESYNGMKLWCGSTAGHGNVLDWISRAGGSFTVAHVYGVTASDATAADHVVINFYHHGLSWGEAIMTSLPRVGSLTTPIGDPMTRINRINPDVSGDGDVDFDDMARVVSDIGKPLSQVDEAEDVNNDGVVSFDDVLHIISAFGRERPTNDTNPFPPGSLDALTAVDSCTWYEALDSTLLHRGDVNGDGYVDFEDLWLVLINQSCDCPSFDINSDGVVDGADVALAANFGPALDVNDDDEISCVDLWGVFLNPCTANCDPTLDLNGDGVIDVSDTLILSDLLVNLDGVGFFGELNYNGNGVLDCEDVAIHRQHHCADAADGCYEAIYDLDGDMDVDCRDEWLLEWLVISFGGDDCPGLGCGECEPADNGIPTP